MDICFVVQKKSKGTFACVSTILSWLCNIVVLRYNFLPWLRWHPDFANLIVIGYVTFVLQRQMV